MGTIAVKNVDARLYRRVKALASLEGKTVGEEVNDALATWLNQRAASPEVLARWDDLEREASLNNRAYEMMRPELLAKHAGEFAVITSGKLAGVFKREEDAHLEAAKGGGAQTIVASLTGRREPRTVELGWSLLG